MIQYRTSDNDMLDQICHAHYGNHAGMVEEVLKANPGLSEKGPLFEAGIVINLPALPADTSKTATVRLWD